MQPAALFQLLSSYHLLPCDVTSLSTVTSEFLQLMSAYITSIGEGATTSEFPYKLQEVIQELNTHSQVKITMAALFSVKKALRYFNSLYSAINISSKTNTDVVRTLHRYHCLMRGLSPWLAR